MFRSLFVLFIVIPIIELYLLIKVGNLLGAWPTIFLVVGAAFAGATVLRWQGVVTWQKVNSTMTRGQLPAQDMIEGVLLFVAGIFLLTPGFITDMVALILLISPARRTLAGWMLSRLFVIRPPSATSAAERRNPTIIDGQYRREE